MSFQELQEPFPMVHLSPTVFHHHCTATAAGEQISDQPLHQCPECGSSIKKPPHFSPEIATNVTAEAPENTTIYGGTTTTTKTKRSNSSLFSTPVEEEPSPKRAATSLYRTFSDSKVNYNETTTPSPEKPQFPPSLCRTFSDPTGSGASYKLNSPKLQESPAIKVLRKLNDGMREMSQWWNQMIQEDEHQEDTVPEEKMNDGMRKMIQWCNQMIEEVANVEDDAFQESNLKMLKEMKDRLREMSQWVADQEDAVFTEENNILQEGEKVTETRTREDCDEESIWVEKKGDGLILHIKCPCQKGYQILLCGNNCYYKQD